MKNYDHDLALSVEADLMTDEELAEALAEIEGEWDETEIDDPFAEEGGGKCD